jgi:hypothetical protein
VASDEQRPAVRVSDADRDRVAALLSEHHAAGRLTFEEFSERLDLAHAARTEADLEAVLTDLPTAAARLPARRQRRRWVVAIMGGDDRAEADPADHTVLLSVMGGADLDLRKADLGGREVTVTAVALMGGSDVYVPEGVPVELTGFALMGGNDNHVPPVRREPGMPLVRVRAFSLMGGVDVQLRRRRERRRA